MEVNGAAIVELQCLKNCDGSLSVMWHHVAMVLLGIVQHQTKTSLDQSGPVFW